VTAEVTTEAGRGERGRAEPSAEPVPAGQPGQ
jgi:hypothetical protein